MFNFRFIAQQEPRRVSRREAFAAQGVSLKFAQRSWSGIRGDRCVVIAIRDQDVVASPEGMSCLLWSSGECSVHGADGASRQERLEHCRLARFRGKADVLVVYGEAAEVERDAVTNVRVELRHGEYWAVWGAATRMAALPRLQPAAVAAARQAA
jgi:hypothetical protein